MSSTSVFCVGLCCLSEKKNNNHKTKKKRWRHFLMTIFLLIEDTSCIQFFEFRHMKAEPAPMDASSYSFFSVFRVFINSMTFNGLATFEYRDHLQILLFLGMNKILCFTENILFLELLIHLSIDPINRFEIKVFLCISSTNISYFCVGFPLFRSEAMD